MDDPEFEKKMAKADDIIGRYRNTLRVLAILRANAARTRKNNKG